MRIRSNLKLSLLSFIFVVFSSAAFGGTDFLASEKVQIQHSKSEKVLQKTVEDLRDVFDRYIPQLDSASEIVSPLKVSGSHSQPIVQVSIQKCIAILCKTVDLDAEMSVEEVDGPCKRNLRLVADLKKSSALLTDVYSHLEVAVCFKPLEVAKGGRLDIQAFARQAPGYQSGLMQGLVHKLLKAQVQPIRKALEEALQANGANTP